MKFKIILLTVFPILAACGATPPQKNKPKIDFVGTEILVIKNIEIASSAIVRQAIRKECQLTEKLSKFLDEYAADQYAQILTNTDLATVPADTYILNIEIDNVIGSSGGGWTGTKGVTLTGELTKNAQVMGSFRGRRMSGGGLFGTYKGTCAILGRCVRALGKDIATWLKKPGIDSIIGDY